jgi:hypothetical protein
VRDVAGFSVERTADTVGLALAVGAAAGVAAHAIATGIHQVRQRRQLPVVDAPTPPTKHDGGEHGRH